MRGQAQPRSARVRGGIFAARAAPRRRAHTHTSIYTHAALNMHAQREDGHYTTANVPIITTTGPMHQLHPRNPKSTASIFGHPLHPMLVGFPITFIVTALISDIVYTSGHSRYWARTSRWLLGAAFVMTCVAAMFGLVDFIFERRIRNILPAWLHTVTNMIVLCLVTANYFMRYPNIYDRVVPEGLVLSAVSTGLLLFSGWMGWDMVYRHRVGIKPEHEDDDVVKH